MPSFSDRLSRLYEAAGAPTYESLARYCETNQQQVSTSSLQEWLTGNKLTGEKSVPRSAAVFRVLVDRLEFLAKRNVGPEHRALRPDEWEILRRQAARERRPGPRRYRTEQPAAGSPPTFLQASVTDLVAEKTDGFVGRQYVFDAIREFTEVNGRGFFTIEGDLGAGKTSIIAEYVRRTGCIAHFNVRSQGITSAAQFMASVSDQLAARYGLARLPLAEAELWRGQALGGLLAEARSAMAAGENLVVAIDALDEVDTSKDAVGANILSLPLAPPEGVYFLLAQRRGRIGLQTASPSRAYDLGEHREQTMADIREYLRQAAAGTQLRHWLHTRGITVLDFIEILADKSEGNFMYLRYVLPDLTSEGLQSLDITDLPQGLESYYQVHWQVMGMTQRPLPRLKIWVLYLLCELARPVTSALLAHILSRVEPGADTIAVQDVLDEWRQFLHREPAGGGPRFSIYHASFRDFLHRNDIVASAGTSVPGVNGIIADALWEHVYGQGDQHDG